MKTFTLILSLLLLAIPAHAREHRSYRAKHTFEAETGYPYGRAGFEADHIIPLACGGPDAAFNIAWQPTLEAKAKDKWERRDCAIWYSGNPPCRAVGPERDEVCR